MPTIRRRLPALLTAATLGAALLLNGPVALAGTQRTYLVLYRATAVPADAAARIQGAGGRVVAAYGQIGVVVARSDNAGFRGAVLTDSRVAAAVDTARTAVRIDGATAADAASDTSVTAVTPATDSDTLSGLQWDMIQIHTPEAHAINGGDDAIIVGDLDTGLDFTHPDLAANYDAANSTDCSSGAPTALGVGNDQNGHGTHTAGTIAAASNGLGIVGVAPNVRIAGIKSSNDAGFFFPEMVVCAFMWAGSHKLDVTNNSYFADPWLFNCRNDAEQRAIFSAEQRAIRWAISQGVVVVASAGNQSDDLAHPTQDVTSPDNTTPVVRDITNACAVVPVEVPGVLGVAANGNLGFKSSYSSYGVGAVGVIAPGGDSFQITAAATNGRVLSTWPSYIGGTRRVQDPSGAWYRYLQGTSMAGPHVAGIAALIRSRFPDLAPGAVVARIKASADPIACPADMSFYAPFPAVDNDAPQVCQGGKGYNGFNGHGQVNALTAVTR